jgi:predicted secreted protein
MILDQKRNDVIIEGGEETVDMHISHNMEEHIMRMLIKAYSDPIGSLIREAASNGIDSHRMAGIQEPVICRLKKDSVGSWFFEMEDFGLGLDEHEFHKYIMGIGESNKRGLAGVIGG